MRLFGRFSKFVGMAAAMAAFLLAASVEAAVQNNSAVVRAVRGSATYSNDKGANWKKLNVGTKLAGNSVVRTSADSVVDLFLGDNGPVVRVTEDTSMGIDKLTSEGTGAEKIIETELNLKNGRILGNVKKLAKASRYEITTPKGVAGIRGTEYDISADGTVTVISGTVVVVYILPGGGLTNPVVVNAGQTVTAPVGGAQPVVIAATPTVLAALGREFADLRRYLTGGGDGTTTGGTPSGPTTIPDVDPNTDPCRERAFSPGAGGGCE